MDASEVTACALYSFDSNDSDEISVQKGDIVNLLEAYDDGWWLVKRGELTGLVPSNYMKIADTPLENKGEEALNIDNHQKKKGLSGLVNDQGPKESKSFGFGRKKTPKSDLAQLKTLREEAEAKINALRYRDV